MKNVLLVILDGIGINDNYEESAVQRAYTPTLDHLFRHYPNIALKAHGTAVGLPTDDDMGNSEVGHNALGCGQIYNQGAKLVDEAILSKRLFASQTWKQAIDKNLHFDSTMHFIGLLSDGNVHSNISHLLAMIRQAKADGVHHVRCHIILDGRDVPATSALDYIHKLEQFLLQLNDDTFCGKIASGGGRMYMTMDRYQADWDMVKRGWDTHVHGIGRPFACATDAVDAYRRELSVIDQDIPEFVIVENGVPIGRIKDNDSVILFNFRGDRAIELSMAFEEENFPFFDRGTMPKVFFAGMLQYDGDLHIPKNYLVDPPKIRDTLTDLLVEHHLPSLAVSETQKYGHVTYFWNGNRSEKIHDDFETWVEIQSDKAPFDQRPWMKAAEITDEVLKGMVHGRYRFIRCNFPNGDMVGHTGNMQATVLAVECVDICLKRLLEAADTYHYTVVITADHGNADKMLEKHANGAYAVRTAHSLNPVPFILYDKDCVYQFDRASDFGLANVAPTIADLFGLEPYDTWERTMLINRSKKG